MERNQRSIILTISGVAIFIGSMIFILPFPEFYLLALVLMFIGVIMIGIGGAMLKGFEKSLDQPEEECYYCKGTGHTEGADGPVTCPRCGGTGIFSAD